VPAPAAAYSVVAAPCTSSRSASGRTVPTEATPVGTLAASSACSRANAPMTSLGGSAAIVARNSATRLAIVDGLVILRLLPDRNC
jgi:hypothetical protein